MGSRPNQPGMLGVFEYLDDVLAALRTCAENRWTVEAVYSPVPCHEIQHLLGTSNSPVRFFTLTGGILGILSGLGLASYSSLQWNFIVSGKPVLSWIPYVIVAFELCILFGILFNLLGLLTKARLPRLVLPDHYDLRFNQDRFGILVRCPQDQSTRIKWLLAEAGAEEVIEVPGEQ